MEKNGIETKLERESVIHFFEFPDCVGSKEAGREVEEEKLEVGMKRIRVKKHQNWDWRSGSG